MTVLFCDVAGSTALGESLDPEALRDVMSSYFDVARAAIERHGGTLEKFIGDAVMAVFGVPTVREDDALRAVRAAEELRDGVEIDVRIGVNTGGVVTGTATRSSPATRSTSPRASSRPPRPARCCSAPERTRLVRDAVDAELLPPIEAKGKAEPLTAYRLRRGDGRRRRCPPLGRAARRPRPRAADARRRLGTLHLRARLLALHDPRQRGRRQVTAVGGVPRRARCDSRHGTLSLLRRRDHLLARGRGGEGAPRGSAAPNATIAALLGEGQAPADEIAIAVRKLFEAAAADRPLVVVFDDIQWGEPTFLDLIEHIGDWSRDAPILLLCLARPELLELRPNWGGGKLNATAVLLEPLSAAETDELIDELLDGRGLDPALRERIRASAEGNPLFVEQMLAMVEESPEQVTVPSTIQALLAARLDQLPAVRARGARARRGRGPGLPRQRRRGARTRGSRRPVAAPRARPQGARPSERRDAARRRRVPLPAPADPRRRLRRAPEGRASRAARALRGLARATRARISSSSTRSSATTWSRPPVTAPSSELTRPSSRPEPPRGSPPRDCAPESARTRTRPSALLTRAAALYEPTIRGGLRF